MGGNPYTMTVELMNVIGGDGDVNHGHPGVMYNAIDENNFDTMHLRFVKWEKPSTDVYLYYTILVMELVDVDDNFIYISIGDMSDSSLTDCFFLNVYKSFL